MGWSLGLGTSVWVQRRVRRAAARVAPPAVREQARETGAAAVRRGRETLAGARLRTLELREAIDEGRRVRRRVEAALREEFGLAADRHRPSGARPLAAPRGSAAR
ncbi:MAG: hypothetical protein D6683_09595 [Actinomyces sp.]|nr:MAG: hypothetical protein D6683_09595 [Actinomyces sp.]